MPADSAWVCGIGMVTPVGDCAAQTASSVRAGISRYQESSIYNKRFEPMTMALLPDDALPELNEEITKLTGLTSRQTRMLRLAHPALLEALEPLPDGEAVPLFLAGPETLRDKPPVMTKIFLNLLSTQAGVALNLEQSGVFTNGRAGGMQALAAALSFLSTGQRDYVLVGGVDSYLDLYLLALLDMQDRVLANGIMDGFAPGEGAGFLLLCSNQVRDTLANKPTVKIHSPGIADEAGYRYSQDTYTGDGLASALTAALQTINGAVVRTVLSGMNGENMSAKEWGVAYMRNSSNIDPDFRFEHPADCFGDTGAAVGPILMGLATMGLQEDNMPGPCVTWCSSEGATRGAAYIHVVQ